MQQTERSIPDTLLAALRQAVGPANVLCEADKIMAYDCDGLTLHKATPGAVVFVHSTAEISAVVKACNAARYPYLARGAGTGLSGGAMALNRAVVVETARMNKILEINVED